MSRFDPTHRTKLVIDEWGVWYPPGEEIAPAYILSQPVTLRDALHTAITLDIFNRHAEKIAMANVAQTINCLHSLFLAQEENYVRTPPFYVFEMFRSHMNARLVPMRLKVADLTVSVPQGSAKMTGLSGSASIRDKRLTVTLTNPSLDSGRHSPHSTRRRSPHKRKRQRRGAYAQRHERRQHLSGCPIKWCPRLWL